MTMAGTLLPIYKPKFNSPCGKLKDFTLPSEELNPSLQRLLLISSSLTPGLSLDSECQDRNQPEQAHSPDGDEKLLL